MTEFAIYTADRAGRDSYTPHASRLDADRAALDAMGEPMGIKVGIATRDHDAAPWRLVWTMENTLGAWL